MKKRYLLAALLCGLVLTACGTKGSTSSSNPDSSTPSSSTPDSSTPSSSTPDSSTPSSSTPDSSTPEVEVKSVVVTPALLELAAYADVTGKLIDGLTIGGKQLGDYGNGIQMRNKNGVPSSFYNEVEADIVSITIKYNASMYEGKDYAPTPLTYVFGTESVAEATEGTKVETVTGTYEYTIEAPEGSKFFKFADFEKYSIYLDSFTVNLKA